jgi:diacylglycerol kinase family enzyme
MRIWNAPAINVRVTLIHNPGAGKHGKEDLERLVHLIKGAGHHVRYQSARDKDWASALDESADLIAVAGGDGTVSRVAKRMVGRSVPVAPLPAGTANNISTTLGLVGRPLEELIRGWQGARHVKLDLGVVEGPWGARYFVEGVGAGLFARAAETTPKEAMPTKPEEKVAFAIRNLREWLTDLKPVRIEASLDGRDLSGDYVLFEAINIPYVGPNLFLAPDSAQGNGQLDVVMAGEAERQRLAHYLQHWEEKKQRLAVLPSHQGRQLRMKWTGFRVHIDDEFWPEEATQAKPPGEISARIEGAAVDFLAPAELQAPDSKKR